MPLPILANAEFFIRWQSVDARHIDHVYFAGVDLRRDIFPVDPGERLLAAGPGVTIETTMAAGKLIPGVTAENLHDLPRRGVDTAFTTRHLPGPFRGRFYPRGWLADCTPVGGLLTTESWRGWPRPEDDKYYPRRRTADPVFAVSGQRR